MLNGPEDFTSLGLNPLNETIPRNYDPVSESFEKAILVFELDDPTVRRSVERLSSNHGIPVITKKNLQKLANVKVLIIVGHGSGSSIAAGLSGVEFAGILKSNGISPGAIDVVSCSRTPGPARQDLANEMGVPVRGAKGRTKVSPDGKQHTLNEHETAKLGNDKDSNKHVYHLDQNQHVIYRPQKGKA